MTVFVAAFPGFSLPVDFNRDKRPTVSLVLGSGGARGLAHIGVIQWLTENGFEIRSIAGSSMGALVGGIYAAGRLEDYTRWVSVLERSDVIRLLDFSFSSSGLLKGERIINELRKLIGDYRIEDLTVAFTAVATDVADGKEVRFSHGSLFDAIRASIAIPTVFTPHSYKGKRYFDGSLVSPMPLAVTSQDKTDLTVAVNVAALPEPGLKPLSEPARSKQKNSAGYRRLLIRFLNSINNKKKNAKEPELGFVDVITRSTEIMQNTITQFQLENDPPDIVIDVPRNVCSFYEFYRARELIEIGRSKAEDAFAAQKV